MMSQAALWNVFDLFVTIETKINYSVAFLYTDDTRLSWWRTAHPSGNNDFRAQAKHRVESCQHDCIKCSNNLLQTETAFLERSGRDASKLSFTSAGPSKKLLRKTGKIDTQHNATGCQIDQEPKRKSKPLQKNGGDEIRHRRSLTGSNVTRPGDKTPPKATVQHQQCPTASECSKQKRKVDADRTSDSNTDSKWRWLEAGDGPNRNSRKQPVFFWINMVVIYCLILRSILNSFFSGHDLDSEEASRLETRETYVIPKNNGTIPMGSSSLYHYVTNLIFCDLFTRFTNNRMSNMVAAGALMPSALLRLIRIERCSKIQVGLWLQMLIAKLETRSRVRHKCQQEAASSDDSIGVFKTRANSRLARDYSRDKPNIVQTDLCYLKSLYTSSKHWCNLLTNCWSHKHKFGSFRQEREMLTKSCDIKRGRDSDSTLDAYDVMTKMYFYNLISFDGCYADYFQQVPELALDDNGQTLGTNRHHHWLSARKLSDCDCDCEAHEELHMEVEGADIVGVHEMSRCSNTSHCPARVAKHKRAGSRKEKGDDIFVAKPKHRMDLNEMGWLLVALTLLYVLSALTISLQALFSFFMETSIKSFGEISPGKMFLELYQFVTTFAFVRWLQMNLLHVIIIFTIFDLYHFFACCLICLSRARYLKMRLQHMSNYCRAVNHLFQAGQQEAIEPVRTSIGGKLNKVERLVEKLEQQPTHQQTEYAELRVIETAGEFILAPTFEGDKFLADASNARHLHLASGRLSGAIQTSRRLPGLHSMSAASVSTLDTLNDELNFVMDLVVLVQRELADLKKFFQLYLNLELTLKSLCIIFSICALFDSGTIFEAIFILITTNTCVVPICITMTTAALIENQFKGICRNLDRILITGGSLISEYNLRHVISLSSFLSYKANRSFVVIGNFSLSLGSLIPIIAWISTGVVMLRRGRD